MSLDKENEIAAFLQKLEKVSPSTILRHSEHSEGACCSFARAWIVALDRTFSPDGMAAPSWLRTHWKWGPVKWPVYWCDIPRYQEFDCGVFAALSCELFASRGFAVVPVQMVQRFSEQDAIHWRAMWLNQHLLPNWINNSYVYHESCGVVIGNEIKIWDAVDNVWIDPGIVGGYGSVVAIRLYGSKHRRFVWGPHELTEGIWQILGEDA